MSKTYSPKDVSISFSGLADVTGWNSISLARNADNSSYDPSADGRISYTKIADRSGTIELEVQQTNTAVNFVMAALQRVQDAADDLFFFDVTVADKSGGWVANCKDCHLQRISDQSLAAEQQGRSYTIMVDEVIYTSSPDGVQEAIQSVINAANIFESISAKIGIQKLS